MFLADQAKRKERDMSIRRTKIGGYNIDCQKVAEDKIDFLPNARKRTSGEALTKESTMPLLRPAGDMAGARAMKRLTFSFRGG